VLGKKEERCEMVRVVLGKKRERCEMVRVVLGKKEERCEMVCGQVWREGLTKMWEKALMKSL
jgi:hypothetical protein